MSYTIAPLSLENIKDLAYLYKKVFGNNYTIDIIKQKYDTSYLDLSHFGHIAYNKMQPIAFHGAIPVLMEHNGNYEIAAQYGDAMTLPKYTGNGLFTELGKLTDNQLKKANVKFVWGFPNQNSEYGYLNKLDWQYVDRMQGFKIKTGMLAVEKVTRKLNFTNQLYESHILKVFKNYTTDTKIKGSVYNEKDIVSTCRNEDFYNYKSFANNFTIAINGVLFWVKIKNGLLIGDIETPSEQHFYDSLNQLKNIAAKNGIGEIIFQTSPNTQITDLLKNKVDECFESWVVGYKSFISNFPLEKLKLTFGDLDTF
ncbi:GNAT family N-acetyltransferase [Winogradskyella sp.]|uniref:GNAT family N-acetyltransferase n=1 Tax=Winogradskyella sp. TaxID=1883156 RepID=UPI0025D15B30|nr:GNAT family N-acetyltransferase [Winogradskyella sp.]